MHAKLWVANYRESLVLKTNSNDKVPTSVRARTTSQNERNWYIYNGSAMHAQLWVANYRESLVLITNLNDKVP